MMGYKILDRVVFDQPLNLTKDKRIGKYFLVTLQSSNLNFTKTVPFLWWSLLISTIALTDQIFQTYECHYLIISYPVTHMQTVVSKN